jgi:hypothetical protein
MALMIIAFFLYMQLRQWLTGTRVAISMHAVNASISLIICCL